MSQSSGCAVSYRDLLSFLSAGAVVASGLACAPAGAQQMAPILLPDVLVTASRVPVGAARVGSAITLIDRAEIERRGDLFVSDLLRDVPGVAVNRAGPMGALTQIRLRGAESNHTLVLIDGIEVNDPAASSEFDFAHLMSADVERIEILRGPQSALWGADAIGGVINIITRRGAGPAHGSASVEGGSFGTVRATASLLGGGSAYDYAFNIAGLRTRGTSIAPATSVTGMTTLPCPARAASGRSRISTSPLSGATSMRRTRTTPAFRCRSIRSAPRRSSRPMAGRRRSSR